MGILCTFSPKMVFVVTRGVASPLQFSGPASCLSWKASCQCQCAFKQWRSWNGMPKGWGTKSTTSVSLGAVAFFIVLWLAFLLFMSIFLCSGSCFAAHDHFALWLAFLLFTSIFIVDYAKLFYSSLHECFVNCLLQIHSIVQASCLCTS